MNVTSFVPDAGSPSWIEGLAVVQSDAGATRTLVAEARVSVGIRVAGAAHVRDQGRWERLPCYTLTGVHCGSRTIRTAPGSLLVLAHLHPVAASMLAANAAQLAGQSVDLATLWPRDELDALAGTMAQQASDAARASLLEEWVRHRLHRRAPAFIVQAVETIRDAGGEIRVQSLASALAVSVDALERGFAAWIGVGPKRFARAVRLRSAVMAYRRDVPLTRLAVAAGYFDQAHFVREMRQATGEPPARLLRSQTYC